MEHGNGRHLHKCGLSMALPRKPEEAQEMQAGGAGGRRACQKHEAGGKGPGIVCQSMKGVFQ